METALRLPATILAAGLALAAAGAASAHHSEVMFDHSRLLTMKGTVKSVDFGAPHSWISILVKPSGRAAVEWNLEAEGTARLMRDGLTRETLKPGDQITAGFYPLHDGRPAGQLVYIVAADGKIYGGKPGGLAMPPP
jgi:hypothetical protein